MRAIYLSASPSELYLSEQGREKQKAKSKRVRAKVHEGLDFTPPAHRVRFVCALDTL
jgi:hypothetical protein